MFDGILDSITLLGYQGTHGLKYKQSKRNGDKAKNQKRLIGRCHNRFPIFLILLSSLKVHNSKLFLLMKTLKKLLRISVSYFVK